MAPSVRSPVTMLVLRPKKGADDGGRLLQSPRRRQARRASVFFGLPHPVEQIGSDVDDLALQPLTAEQAADPPGKRLGWLRQCEVLGAEMGGYPGRSRVLGLWRTGG